MQRFSLDRSKIIRRGSEFNGIFTSGRRVSSANLTIFYKRGESLRFGLAVSRQAGSAVKRNLIKRRLREVARHHVDLMPDDLNFVILGKPGVARCEFHRFNQEFVDLLRKVQRASIAFQ